ncbi:MAG: GFA family protein [Nevskiaceae bacterium]|nr:MAG: GFA family protein [Nevskiaceae bacterium]
MPRGRIVEKVVHKGGCHCGAVRFELRAPARITVQRCNCSMCARTGFEHLIVPAADFTLLRGAEQLTTYTFNTGVARHLFCKVCGIKSFYVPRSNPDGYSVNLRCLDAGSVEQVTYEDFDGQNWEKAGHTLAGLSKGERA